MKRMAILVVTLMAVAAQAQDWSWLDSNGKPAPETESQKSRGGFGGWLVATSDQDWREKWETPRSRIPQFTEAKTVALGQRVFVLIFFANPKVSPGKHVDVTCDLKVTRPDNTISKNEKNIECYQGVLKTDPGSVFLSVPTVGFVGEPTDPLGRWVVEVTLRDNHRGVELPLRTSFVLK